MQKIESIKNPYYIFYPRSHFKKPLIVRKSGLPIGMQKIKSIKNPYYIFYLRSHFKKPLIVRKSGLPSGMQKIESRKALLNFLSEGTF
jgi:hypothetical protein